MANLDHATIVAEADGDLRAWLKTNQQKHFVVSGSPTSEILAKVIFDQARSLGFALATVAVCETCTASASYTT